MKIIIIFLILLLIIILGLLYINKKKYKYGIVLCCYNRPEFLKKTLNSLSHSNLENSIICIIDDCSTDANTINLIKNFKINNIPIIKIRNANNLGISKSLLRGFETLLPKCYYLTNIDSDVIMKKNWLSTLEYTYNKVKNSNLKGSDYIITGFNCSVCVHPIIKQYDSFNHKKSIGGINMFFHYKLFKRIFKKILLDNKNHWDWRVVDKAHELNILLITTKSSVIQHIGITGMNSDKQKYDYAEDYD
tara:strand:+ start:80 stop:820 length:741 start_codon:yes stop_codon:yes gene_type:complete